MKQNSIEIFNLLAHASKIHDEIYRLRCDIRDFLRNEDHTQHCKNCNSLRTVEQIELKEAQEFVGDAVINLCCIMREEEEEKEHVQ